MGHSSLSAREDAGRRRTGSRPCPAAGRATHWDGRRRGQQESRERERTGLHRVPLLKHPEEPYGGAAGAAGAGEAPGGPEERGPAGALL